MNDLSKDKIIYMSNPENIPDEFKENEKDIDPLLSVPYQFREKKFRMARKNIKLGIGYKNSFKLMRKYKDYNAI
jgi:hypothetical protein